MRDLFELLKEIRSGTRTFVPRTQSPADLDEFQPEAEALEHAHQQGLLSGFKPLRINNTGQLRCVIVHVNGLSNRGKQYVEATTQARLSGSAASYPINMGQIVETLRLASLNQLPAIIDRTSSVSLQAVIELLDEAYLAGAMVQSTHGLPVLGAQITVRGRLFLERSQTEGGSRPSSSDQPSKAPVSEAFARRLLELLQLYEQRDAREATRIFRDVSHDQLIEAFNRFLFHHRTRLKAQGWGDNIQSLRDRGVDSAWHLTSEGAHEKVGVQIKSCGDLEQCTESFRRTVLAQITESHQLGLSALFLAMGADLTDRSQEQKSRGLLADVLNLQDGYVYAISPEKLLAIWQWFTRSDSRVLDLLSESGYAHLTLVYDSLGNRNQNSFAKNQKGEWSHEQCTRLVVGERVDLSAVAMTVDESPVQYQFAVQRSGQSFEIRQNWGRSCRLVLAGGASGHRADTIYQDRSALPKRLLCLSRCRRLHLCLVRGAARHDLTAHESPKGTASQKASRQVEVHQTGGHRSKPVRMGRKSTAITS